MYLKCKFVYGKKVLRQIGLIFGSLLSSFFYFQPPLSVVSKFWRNSVGGVGGIRQPFPLTSTLYLSLRYFLGQASFKGLTAV